jgi:hypothetical protein
MLRATRALIVAALVAGLGVVSGAGVSHAAAYRLVASSLPYNNTSVNRCIGGEQCDHSTLTVDLTKPMGIGTVSVFAHDNIGDKANALLMLRVNGRYLAYHDVKKEGSTLTFTVNQVADSLEFADLENDEIMIKSIAISSSSVGSTWPTQGLHHFVVSAMPYSNASANTCIGGALCYESGLVVDFSRRASVTTIEVFAHDQVGSSTKGTLELRVDDEWLANEYGEPIVYDVQKEGSLITIQVSQVAERLEFRSANDETVIKSLKINGQLLATS